MNTQGKEMMLESFLISSLSIAVCSGGYYIYMTLVFSVHEIYNKSMRQLVYFLSTGTEFSHTGDSFMICML